MAMNVAEAEAMITAAKAASVKLRVYENFVFYPPYRRAMELIQTGQIGEPQMIHLHLGAGSQEASWKVPLSAWLWRFRKSKSGGGCWSLTMVITSSLSLAGLWGQSPVQAWIDYTTVAPCTILTHQRYYVAAHGLRRYGVMDVTYSSKLRIESDYYSADERVEIVAARGLSGLTVALPVPSIAQQLSYSRGQDTAYDDMPTGWESSLSPVLTLC